MEYLFRLVGVVEKEAVAQYGPSLRSPLLARDIPLTGYKGQICLTREEHEVEVSED